MNSKYVNNFQLDSIGLEEKPKNSIEQLLHDSAALFMQTGMPELAKKWQKILDNYRWAKSNH